MSLRDVLLHRLRTQSFDLLIVGGGIVGAGIARDAAMRGLRVALIEQGDFASGTSSKTSKLIHGGLRYLEQGHLRLVFESLRERAVLREIAPALVHPRSLLLPIYDGNTRPMWKVRSGLGLYDLLAWGRNIRPHRVLSPKRALALEAGLRLDGLRGAGLYADCQMDDARLCLANIIQAVGFGAVCVNYVTLRAFLRANGQLCGGTIQERHSGDVIEVQARVVINATGPWVDGVRRLSEAAAPSRLAPTKGIHLVLPRMTEQALFVEARSDRRMLFLLPWGDYTLVGTTESPIGDSLDTLRASAEEVGYLLEEVHRVLPGTHLGEDDVMATFAGARPLLAFSGPSSRASREHRIEIDRWGLVSVMGGKYTTYRRMAQQAVDVVVRQHRWRADRCLTDQVSLFDVVQPVTLHHWQDLVRSVDPDLMTRLLTQYGAGVFHLLRLLNQEPELARPLCPHHETIAAELAYAVQQELACTVTDLLARRTRIAWSSCQGLDALTTVADGLHRYGAVPRTAIEQQIAEYHQFLAQGLAFRGTPTPSNGSSGAVAGRAEMPR